MDTVYSSQKFFYLPPSPHVDYKPSKRRGPFKPLPCCLKQRLAHSEFLITTYYIKRKSSNVTPTFALSKREMHRSTHE